MKKFTTDALLVAVICVLTLAIRIPTPTGGYINLGDLGILFAGFMLGGVRGGVVAALGSAMAEFLGGNVLFILPTFFIKGIEGTVAGLITTGNKDTVTLIIAAIAGSIVMIGGYYLFELLWINETAAAIVIIPNIIQGVVCSVCGIALYQAIKKQL